MKQDLSLRIRPLLDRIADRRHIGIAASLALLILAGSIASSLIARKPAPAPESTVQAASQPPVVKTASVDVRSPRLPGGRPGVEGIRGPARFITVLTVTVGRDENLDLLIRKYLGTRLNQQVIDEILVLNPQITDPNKIETGDRIRLPLSESRISVSSSSLPRGAGDEQ